mmetsp:Transcript_29206/g.68843  ORF Transcript_29206/g.68843 Transcript_29206/m.68843 type:complete len:1197 (+) Transcript_29206:67-3657(+)
MRQKARTRPTGPDVRAQGLDTATLGRSICQHISVKGFCIIDPEVEEEYLDSVLADISAVDEQGRFVSLPAGIVEGLLGKEGSCRVADVGVTTEHAMVSVFTESFVRDGAALRYFDDEFSRYANLLFAHLALAKIPVTSRSSSLLHEAAKPKSEGPALTEEVCSKWLRVMSSHRLICIWCLGPENGTLELKPWDEDAESMQVSMRPGRLVIARADALHHRFSSVGCAYCLTCFFNNIVAAEQEPVSPCGFALQQWAKERMTRYKQSTVQEKRYMEMPRDWEEKINREMVNTQRIALRTACTKQPGTEDTLGFALAMNSGPDYALSVPMMRWEHEMVYEDDIMAWQNGKTCCMHGAFIEGIELFDCTAFRISRAEASGMDPGHRLTLETGYEALVKDGYRANTLMNSRGGVYVANPPPVEWAMTPKDITAGGVCGGGGSIACGRFSFVHGLKGPCISVDVEGASSLVVVNYACANLSWTGGWEPIPFALCNSWNLQLNPAPYVHLSSCGLLSPKGRTFAFDASACGYIRGDCVTSIVLKAGNVEGEAENELGYLAGSATNQSGRRSHLAAPDCLALQEVIHEALRQTQITGLDVDAVESCADGKILDDSLEATAFARAYRPQGTLNVDDTAPLGIISAKSGVGNQLEAAGISQILKVILGSRAAAFHPTPHLRIVNPHIDIEMCERNAIIAGESLDFRLPSTYTGILNRSMAGTNCHAIVFAKVPSEVYRPRKAIQAPYKEAVQPILFWPKGGGALAEDMQPRMGYSIMGTFTRWRPQPMQMEGPGVYGATIILSENRWERFQIAVDGDTARVLHPILPQGDKCCPVAGPEAVLQILSWHIEGRPKDAMQAEDLPDTSQQKQLTIGDSSAWTVIVPDELPSFDDQTAVAGDRFRVRLHVQGRWRMVDWEKLPKDEETDTPADRAFRASLDGLVGTYQVVGSWTMNDCQAMKPDPARRHLHRVEVTIPVTGDQQFHLLRNEDRCQVIGPEKLLSRVPGRAVLRAWDQRSSLNSWAFRASVGDVFRIEFERQAEAEDMMKVSWECVSTDAPVPEELALLHLRRKYMVRLCFGSWSNHSYKMAWQGTYFHLFLELNELAKVSFVIYEDGQTSRCLFPSVKDANPHEGHELQGPGPATEGLFWTIGAHEKDQAVNGSRYELRLHLAEGNVPMSVDWVRVKSTKGLEDAAANGNFVAWLPAAS